MASNTASVVSPARDTESSHAGLCDNDIVASSAQLQASRQPHEPPFATQTSHQQSIPCTDDNQKSIKGHPYLEAALLGHLAFLGNQTLENEI